MSIEDLGFTTSLADYIVKNNLSEFTPGRIMQEHRERYIVSSGEREYDAEITGNMRFSATGREDFPAVGDWVAMAVYEPDMAIIHHILPRKSILSRQAIGKPGEKQIIASNVDAAFILQAVNNNFNINRLERYMAICLSAGIEPVLVLTKTDLLTEAEVKEEEKQVKQRQSGLNIILLDNISGRGLESIALLMKKGKTYCVLGSSGVGKSTLINNLLRKNLIRTAEISSSTNKGKHTTVHRELYVIPGSGAILIDNPGMKELGITDDFDGITGTFREISELALRCRFPDCTHTGEKGCAVSEALENGIIDARAVDNYRRMLREQERYSSTEAERRKKDRAFGKMAKEIMKEKKKNKF